MPTAALVDMIQAIVGDLEPVAVQTHRELRQYAYGVAGTVGVMMTCLLQVERRADALPHAVDLGIGMQLTNIARDVLEDAHLGRVYLPAAGAAGALRATDITSGDAAVRHRAWNGVQELLLMAEAFYDNGWRGLGYLPMRARLSIAVAARVYREIGVKILREGESAYWRHRCVVGRSQKFMVSTRALVDLFMGSGMDGPVDDPSGLHRDLNVCFPLSG
jgi:phytoene synthase